MARSLPRDRTATIAAFISDAIDLGARIVLPRLPDLPGLPSIADFGHLPAGVIRDTARVLHALGIDGDAALNLISQHAVARLDAALQLGCSVADVLSLIERSRLGGLSEGGDWLVSRRGLERLAFVAEVEKWLYRASSDSEP